ncbi:MAG TPA: FAD-dependent monooxygenase [Acidimicrobiales bacterium]|nr:FAD-dependent monooxygenase [Acidimicrobiales bacterium]
MHDVVVVGARCAGASLALLLARGGHRVALVDRVAFPSDTMSTHFLWQRGAARLAAWGLLDPLEARGCEPIEEICFDVGPVQLTGIGPAVDGVRTTYCPRRTVLDALLVDAAVAAGAELIEGVVVRDVRWAEGRVVGVTAARRGGGELTLGARLVVGADGLHSTVARCVAAPLERHHPAMTGVYYSYWSGVEGVGAGFHALPGRLVLTWPTNDGLTCISVAWPEREFRGVTRDVEGSLRAAFELVPGLSEAVAGGHRQQRFTGTSDLPNQYRTSAGPGWALIGDAGHHKDPSTGMGMSDALISAELLAAAVDDGLTGRRDLDAALIGYQQQRDAVTANGFALTLSTARLAPLAPRHEALYRHAASRPDVIDRIFGVLGGSLPVGDVYGKASLAALGE